MNTSKEHAEELARFLNEGITERESEFFDAQAAVVRGKASPAQQALVEERLKKEPWRRRIFEEVKAHAESETPETRRAEKERIFSHIGLDLPAIEEAIEREKASQTGDLGQQFHVVKRPAKNEDGGEETNIVWIRSPHIWKANLEYDTLNIRPRNVGESSARENLGTLESNVPGADLHHGVVDGKIIFSWSSTDPDSLPTSGKAYLSIGETKIESKIESDELGGAFVSFTLQKFPQNLERSELVIEIEGGQTK